ncbi:MAG: hypothetical protein D4R88_09530 [Methanosarcinales archaeon]|nr:MAG: hypothetical protein D4R88_09530 [Methanosarcinales archaeon]
MKSSIKIGIGALLTAMLLLSMVFVPVASAQGANDNKDKKILEIIRLQPEAGSEVILDSFEAILWYDAYIYLLFAVTLGVLLAITKERDNRKGVASPLLVSGLIILSFLLMLVSGLMLLFSIGIFGNFSIATEPVNLIVLFLMIFILFGALLILAKEKALQQKWTSDSASLILVSDLLVLSFLTGFSIGVWVALINFVLILFLLMKALHYKLIFYIILVLNIFFLASYFLF